ncbi:hypothetical protein JZ751_025807 [Albula glossodonta]|uniref:Uncharacterized protein n=1 Tax=Albula glossodonta TaxID=121402 RepID=A0A8T2ND63_9TELE|nr:hypothetical protein JZ751_025807 [Albula glossodonta]
MEKHVPELIVTSELAGLAGALDRGRCHDDGVVGATLHPRQFTGGHGAVARQHAVVTALSRGDVERGALHQVPHHLDGAGVALSDRRDGGRVWLTVAVAVTGTDAEVVEDPTVQVLHIAGV